MARAVLSDPSARTEAPRSRMLVGYSRRGRFARQLRAAGIRAKGEDVKSRTRSFIPQGIRAAILRVSTYFWGSDPARAEAAWFPKMEGKERAAPLRHRLDFL